MNGASSHGGSCGTCKTCSCKGEKEASTPNGEANNKSEKTNGYNSSEDEDFASSDEEDETNGADKGEILFLWLTEKTNRFVITNREVPKKIITLQFRPTTKR